MSAAIARKPVHLVMVTAENNNKFYDMIPDGDSFTIKYGRINATCTTLSKPMSEWDKIYRSKVKKGYVDKSELVAEAVINKDYATIADRDIAVLVDRLQGYAKHTIARHYEITAGQVTPRMITEAEQVLGQLVNTADVQLFNDRLLELFTVIPRKMSKVQYFLAESKHDFQRIITKETDLLEVMKTQAVIATQPVASGDDLLTSLGLTITKKDFNLEKEVRTMLGDISHKYVNCWYAGNNATAQRYDNRLASMTGVHAAEQKFWHGSRNENWFSILKTGMMIRPAGVATTGAMFGNGIYFADRAKKSFGYTSARGSYWANGNDDHAYMAIFKVNTGKHHNVYRHTSACYDFNRANLLKAGNYDSVYAHKGADLVNNEYIVYGPDQCTIYALVELKG